MKLLLDNNVSPKLVAKLADLYADMNHVALLGLEAADDITVWQAAQRDKYCLVTKDADFNDLLAAKGFPPKIIWVRVGNCTTATIALLLRTHHQAITAFLEDETVGLLELL